MCQQLWPSELACDHNELPCGTRNLYNRFSPDPVESPVKLASPSPLHATPYMRHCESPTQDAPLNRMRAWCYSCRLTNSTELCEYLIAMVKFTRCIPCDDDTGVETAICMFSPGICIPHGRFTVSCTLTLRCGQQLRTHGRTLFSTDARTWFFKAHSVVCTPAYPTQELAGHAQGKGTHRHHTYRTIIASGE